MGEAIRAANIEPANSRIYLRLPGRSLRIERRAAIEVEDAAAQTELRHLDGVLRFREFQRLPITPLCINLDQGFARLDHDGIEVLRRFHVTTELQSDLIFSV